MASVNLIEWFKQAIKKDRWKEPGWVTQIFCVTELENMKDVMVDVNKPIAPFELFVFMDDKTYCYWDADENEFIQINNTLVTEPLFKVEDKIKLNPGDIANVKESVDSTLGCVIINLYMCVYAFGDKVPYFNGQTKGGDIEKYIVSKSQERTKDAPIDAIFPDEIVQYKKATMALAPFAMICCASADKASLTINPKVLELRDSLFAKHKDELSNPAVVADIEKQCVDLDIELRKGSISDGFFMGDRKLQAVGRKKAFISYGLEGGLGGELSLVKNSLSEGINYQDLPLYADAITAASQSRGLLTAQGGELVKYNLRMFQNASISMDDCGTTGYIDFLVTASNVKMLPTRYMFMGKETVMITSDQTKSLIGTRIKLRSPGYCLASGRNFCKHCVDVNIAARPNGIATTTSKGSSVIMNVAMKKMHGTVLEAFDFIIADHIS